MFPKSVCAPPMIYIAVSPSFTVFDKWKFNSSTFAILPTLEPIAMAEFALPMFILFPLMTFALEFSE